jgi:FMN phosphatase YigB (HAD superfamily)
MSASYHEAPLTGPRPRAILVDVGVHLDLLGRRADRTVVDSAIVGAVEPDPRIFQIALERLGLAPADAMMIGDLPTADVSGARALGIRAALVDPHDIHSWVDAPRFPDFPAFVTSLTGS